ncbi:MAG: metallophosphoesterase [Christensenellaceae bacterium]|jgi:hypothetical protein|nr:metallophosphoesterase [Christensenellaceae bacterium]
MEKKKRTKKTKGKIMQSIFKGFLIFAGFIILLSAVCSLISFVGLAANMKLAESFTAVTKDDYLTPTIDPDTGYYTFVTDRDFRILQVTDTHVGAGFMSVKKDAWAINAVKDLVNYVKPDLIIITGDMIYSDFTRTGNINNMTATRLFARAIENLGVYWTVAFGNHDSDVYARFDRDEIATYYESSELPHCIFQRGPDNIFGYGNQVVNVKNTSGTITQSIFVFDSNQYRTGFRTDYDNIHEDQIEWYKNEVLRLDAYNKQKGATETLQSLAFFHIPMKEYRTAWHEYIAAGSTDTENVQYVYGIAGESDKIVWSSDHDDLLFETMIELGSTQGVFVGHDHLNNFSIMYNGGAGDRYIKLTYSLSIDYLAYWGIYKKTAQRGGTVIDIKPNGEFSSYALRLKNFEVV